MATLYWTGNAVAIRCVYTVTVTAAAVNGTITATINSKSHMYTAAAGVTTTTAAAAAVAAFQASTIPEFGLVTWANPSAGVITATGPANGRTVTITWAADGVNCTISGGGSPSTAAASPNNWNAAANFSTGSRPSTGDTVIIDGKTPSIWWGLDADAASVVHLKIRKGYRGSIGLPERHDLGFNEFLPTRLQTRATALDIWANGTSTYKILSTAVGAVTMYFRGDGTRETLEISGMPASSVIDQNGGGLVIAPLDADTCTVATLLSSGKGWVRCGPGATLGTASFYGSSGRIAGPYTNLVVDQGGKVTTDLAAAGTTTKVWQGTIDWGSTGAVGTYTIGSKGVLDFSEAPAAVAITAGTIQDGGKLVDPAKLTGGYNVTVNNVDTIKMLVGNGRTLTYT